MDHGRRRHACDGEAETIGSASIERVRSERRGRAAVRAISQNRRIRTQCRRRFYPGLDGHEIRFHGRIVARLDNLSRSSERDRRTELSSGNKCGGADHVPGVSIAR